MAASRIDCDICIIGAGSGGLSVAAGAAQLGRKVVLIEKHKMGGDCLNTGCVPSKALIAAAARAQAMREAGPFGIKAVDPAVDYAKVMDHVHEVIAAIAPMDSVERFTGLGVNVIQATARFVSPREVEAGGKRIRARRFVIATGSRAVAPPIPGLADVPYLTNETLWDNRTLPSHLVVIGAGPIGLEMAQAHRRLGAKVTVLEAFKAFARDDAECAGVVLSVLRREGIDIREGAKIEKISGSAGAISIALSGGEVLSASHLLVAAGRAPNVEGLGLEEAGISFTKKGIAVDTKLRTANKRIYAIGDVAGGLQFTHVAGYQAGLVIRSALFRFGGAYAASAIPWATYTDPELAHVGLNEADAAKLGPVTVSRWKVEENDRAHAERHHDGLIKVVVGKGGRILGCTIAAPHAGDLILPWVMAVQKKMTMRDMAGVVAPYPTLSEISKRAAGAWFTPTLFSPKVKRLVSFLSRFG
ncbi:MAG TPA: FAD-dependent oxidoreductase [Micropepsaceae bacterium]|nr:FAD-dependent oxidoreductase [Micropepsaceae bacterium]